MRCIFLDHDGVICLSNNWGGRTKKWSKYRSENPESSSDKRDAPVEVRFDDFDEKAVRILNQILEETGAEIALTPDLGDCTWENPERESWVWSPRWDLEMSRVVEIRQYLHDHPEITHWVAIDDLDMGKNGEPWKNWGLDNFVLTPRSNEGIKQSGIKEKVIKYLK
jgi:hypothetical protein